MSDKISEQWLDQRLRNRILEALWNLAEGDAYVHEMGAGEYFNAFFDFMAMDDQPRPNSVMGEGEMHALEKVCGLMNDACNATPRDLEKEQLIASGWPRQIQPHAEEALAIFLEGGASTKRSNRTLRPMRKARSGAMALPANRHSWGSTRPTSAPIASGSGLWRPAAPTRARSARSPRVR